MDSEGVGTAGGVQFHFADSPKFTEYVWQNDRNTWKWAVDWISYGNPHHGSTYPAYEYDAHDVYLHDCETHPLSETCVQKGSDSCHGFALHMQAKQDNQAVEKKQTTR